MLEGSRLIDQASGLRRLLRPAALHVVPVAGGRDSAQRCGVVVNLAVAAAQEGYAVVVLDQSRGDVARALGLKPRYDLIHLLSGEKRFSEVALEGPDGLRVLPAARGIAEMAARGGAAQSLFGAFARLERPADLVLINIEDPLAAGAMLPSGDGEVLLVASADRSSMTAAYTQIKQLASNSGQAHYRLLMCDVTEGDGAAAAALNIATVARQFLSAHLAPGASIPRSARALAPAVRDAPDSAAARAWRALACAIPEWSTFDIHDGPSRRDSPHLARQGA